VVFLDILKKVISDVYIALPSPRLLNVYPKDVAIKLASGLE